MIRRVILENYMSHARTVIEPAGGLTVLVGPNNCGKSAIVSALQTLCDNAAGDYMVRHGERVSSVTVETDDGHVLTWRRSGDSVSYKIDGRAVHRVGRGVPDDLHDLLRLPRVKSEEEGKEEFDVHFGAQKAPIFLLDQTERKAALFFASSSDAALLMQMQQRHREKSKEKEREKKALEAHLEKLKRSVEALEPVRVLSEGLEGLEAEHEGLKALEGSMAQLARDASILEKEESACALARRSCQAFAPLQRPPEIEDAPSIERLLAQLTSIARDLRLESARLDAASSLAEPPPLVQTSDLGQLIEGLERAGRDLALKSALASSLSALEIPPILSDVRPLEILLQDCEKAALEIDEEARRLEALKDEAGGVEKRIRDWVRENPTCPTCGMEIDPRRLLAEEHSQKTPREHSHE